MGEDRRCGSVRLVRTYSVEEGEGPHLVWMRDTHLPRVPDPEAPRDDPDAVDLLSERADRLFDDLRELRLVLLLARGQRLRFVDRLGDAPAEEIWGVDRVALAAERLGAGENVRVAPPPGMQQQQSRPRRCSRAHRSRSAPASAACAAARRATGTRYVDGDT